MTEKSTSTIKIISQLQGLLNKRNKSKVDKAM
jgi:hypothetical protein